jgi:hypothetical protein
MYLRQLLQSHNEVFHHFSQPLPANLGMVPQIKSRQLPLDSSLIFLPLDISGLYAQLLTLSLGETYMYKYNLAFLYFYTVRPVGANSLHIINNFWTTRFFLQPRNDPISSWSATICPPLLYNVGTHVFPPPPIILIYLFINVWMLGGWEALIQHFTISRLDGMDNNKSLDKRRWKQVKQNSAGKEASYT